MTNLICRQSLHYENLTGGDQTAPTCENGHIYIWYPQMSLTSPAFFNPRLRSRVAGLENCFVHANAENQNIKSSSHPPDKIATSKGIRVIFSPAMFLLHSCCVPATQTFNFFLSQCQSTKLIQISLKIVAVTPFKIFQLVLQNCFQKNMLYFVSKKLNFKIIYGS